MMGRDIETMIKYIEQIKTATTSAIVSLANATSYQMTSRATHGGLSTASCTPVENEVSASSGMGAISSAMSSLSESCNKMDQLEKNHYIDSSEFNDCIGSPWYELKKLKQAVTNAESFGALNYVGDKAGMLAMLNLVLCSATDAKWAIIYYHDYIQRGFDYMFNNNEPSIVYDNGIDKEPTIGNVEQEYDENVHIPVPSIDPY